MIRTRFMGVFSAEIWNQLRIELNPANIWREEIKKSDRLQVRSSGIACQERFSLGGIILGTFSGSSSACGYSILSSDRPDRIIGICPKMLIMGCWQIIKKKGFTSPRSIYWVSCNCNFACRTGSYIVKTKRGIVHVLLQK